MLRQDTEARLPSLTGWIHLAAEIVLGDPIIDSVESVFPIAVECQQSGILFSAANKALFICSQQLINIKA